LKALKPKDKNMNTPLNNSKFSTKARIHFSLLALCLLLLSACSTTQKVAINQADVNCAFLANECALLAPGVEGQAGLRYLNPAAQWTQFNKVMIDPVTFWSGSSTRVSPSDQQTLVNYLFQQLNTQLGQKFEVVYQPGPGVMKLDTALVDMSSATPVLRTITMIVPQARALSSLRFLATGSFPFVGGAQAELKITDSISGDVLGLFVDRRIGGGAISNAFQWRWGDAENAVNHWAELATSRLYSWTSGTATPQ
jgi:hypothetical protein